MTRKKLASLLSNMDGKTSKKELSEKIEILTNLESLFAAMRVKEVGFYEACKAEFIQNNRIEAMALKLQNKIDKANAKKTK